MEISEVRIKLMEDSDDRLQAFCSITFDDAFVVRDLKIIDGTNGPFVAMPSRKLTSHCHQCGSKNHLKAAYCNQCGARQRDDRTLRDSEGRTKLYADIAHPIHSTCREMIQTRVISEYRTEIDRAKQPGYVSKYDDDYDDDVDTASLLPDEPSRSSAGQSHPAGMPRQQPPAPHISPAAHPAGGTSQPVGGAASQSSSLGGPHFTNPAPQQESAKHEGAKHEGAKESPESRETSSKSKSARGDFGAGVF